MVTAVKLRIYAEVAEGRAFFIALNVLRLPAGRQVLRAGPAFRACPALAD